jgi:hypothetical protein
MIVRTTVLTLLLAAPAFAQDALTPQVMTSVRSAIAPALSFPATDDSGAVPANGSTEALWMVRWPEAGEQVIEVIANPLNEVNQLRATRAMAQIQHNIEAAQRRAALQYDRAVAEAKRTGRSQDVDGVTLSDEGIAGAKIDAESHVVIDVAFNQPIYRREVESGVQPNSSVQLHQVIPAAVDVVTLPSNTYREPQTNIERFCEAETIVYLGRVSKPVMKKREDSSVFEVTAEAAPADGGAISSLVVRFRGNEVLMADIVRKTNWDKLLELLK